MALGAPVTAIAAAVVGRSVALAALGAVLGMGGALALSQAMTAVLYGVTATDPTTYLGAATLALAAALVAAWIPMRRAAGIDPIQSLRRV
jgi:putative ABC transport system permease protein